MDPIRRYMWVSIGLMCVAVPSFLAHYWVLGAIALFGQLSCIALQFITGSKGHDPLESLWTKAKQLFSTPSF